MENFSEALFDEFNILHRCLAVQTTKGFRLADENDQKILLKAFRKYLELKEELCLPNIQLPVDNETLKDLLPLKRYNFLFNPRQALTLSLIINFVKQRIRLLVEKDKEFGSAVGLYLAFGIDRAG